MNKIRKVLFLWLLLLPFSLWARGLSFSEEMHGYAYYQGEFRNASVYLKVVINDIDAWRANPNVAASVTGTLNLDRISPQPINGTLQILAPAPGQDGRLLTYRLASSTLQYVGVKHVRDNAGMDVVDDMTTLHGVFLPHGQAAPTIYDLLYRAMWSSELHFEWWKPSVLLNFAGSFSTINTPWYEDLIVKILFLKTVFGSLAREFFPWAV